MARTQTSWTMDRYYKVVVYVKVTDDECRNWSEGADESFHMADRFHNPDDNQYLGNVTSISEGKFLDKRFAHITEEGGV